MLYNSDLDLYQKQQQAILRVKHAQQQAEQRLSQSQQLFEPQNAPDLTPHAQNQQSMPNAQARQPNNNAGRRQNFGNGPTPNVQQNFAYNAQQGGVPDGSENAQQGGPSFGQGFSGRAAASAGQTTTPKKSKGLTDLLGGLMGQNTTDTLKSTLSSVTKPIEGILDSFDIDSEKLIILLVMWVVFNEKADKTLLMALGYLLL